MKYYIKAFQNYAIFTGRASRAEYWYFVLFHFIASFCFAFVCGIFGKLELSFLYTVIALLPAISVSVRRMHDVGKSGWFCLIPIYNFILAVSEGDKGDNQYGPDPKEIEE